MIWYLVLFSFFRSHSISFLLFLFPFFALIGGVCFSKKTKTDTKKGGMGSHTGTSTKNKYAPTQHHKPGGRSTPGGPAFKKPRGGGGGARFLPPAAAPGGWSFIQENMAGVKICLTRCAQENPHATRGHGEGISDTLYTHMSANFQHAIAWDNQHAMRTKKACEAVNLSDTLYAHEKEISDTLTRAHARDGACWRHQKKAPGI